MQFLKFLVAGGTGAAANIVSRFGFDFFVSFEIAVLLAYLVGMITAYLISSFYVFKPEISNSKTQMVRFTIVNIFSAAIVWIVSVAMARHIFPALNFDFYPKDIAHIIAVGSTAISSYLMHKHFTFSK